MHFVSVMNLRLTMGPNLPKRHRGRTSSLQNLLAFCSIFFLGFISPTNSRSAEIESQPLNVLFILADDLGAQDVGCYGTDLIETPHIDRLANEALVFRRAYSPAPVCTPTRASIMTGKHPARLKMTIWSEGAIDPPQNRTLIPGHSLPDLPLSEVTLAEKFREHGYLTAMIGKWHLGDTAHGPETQGFDVAIGGNHWGAPSTFFFPYRGKRSNGEYRYLPGLGYGKKGEYLTDRLTDETIRAIDYAQQESRPFFIMLNHYAPHTPIEAKKDSEQYFQKKLTATLNHKNVGYAAMIQSLDESVGRILHHLERVNLRQNTIVIFTSDNGGYIGTDSERKIAVTSNWPLRSGKSSLYEGGIRVPLILYWPNKKGMSQECQQTVSLTDLHPTLLKAVGSPPKISLNETEIANDAIDLSPLLNAPMQSLPSRSVYFHYPHYYHAPQTTPCSSVLRHPWKLIYYYETDTAELYHLEQDPSEQLDLSTREPEIAAELEDNLKDWLSRVKGELPVKRQQKP